MNIGTHHISAAEIEPNDRLIMPSGATKRVRYVAVGPTQVYVSLLELYTVVYQATDRVTVQRGLMAA